MSPTLRPWDAPPLCVSAKAKKDKEPRDEKAAATREKDEGREARRLESLSRLEAEGLDFKKWAADKAVIETQRPGVHKDVSLWKTSLPSDGNAMRGKLWYDNAALRNLLKLKNEPDFTRSIPLLRREVEKAYSIGQ